MSNVVLKDGLAKREAFTVAGVQGRFKYNDKTGVPGLWPKLIAHLPLAGQKGFQTYGVAWSDGKDASFNYVAGVEVGAGAKLPEGFERVKLGPQSYLVFRVAFDGSALHPQMQTAMGAIWQQLVPKCGHKPVHAPNFELYPADFDPAKPGTWIDYYVPVMA